MLRLIIGCALLVTMLAFSTARAQERTEDQCMALHPEITSPVEMVTCTSDLEGSKKQLNQAYGALAKKFGVDQRAALEKAQRLWLDYRLAECQFETGGYPGDTMYDSGVISCTADMNRQRAAEFQKMAD